MHYFSLLLDPYTASHPILNLKVSKKTQLIITTQLFTLLGVQNNANLKLFSTTLFEKRKVTTRTKSILVKMDNLWIYIR